MRLKYLVPAALTTAALTLTSCSASGLPDSVKTGGLDNDQKAVVEVWYDVSANSDKKRIEELSQAEITAAVTAFALLCLVSEDQAADHLTTGPHGVDRDGAERLADAIDDHLCETKHKPKDAKAKKSSSPHHSAPGATANAPSSPNSRSFNRNHDLNKPTAWHDREEATLKAPANREPAWTHNDTAAKSPQQQAPKAAAPAAKAPASTKH